MPLTTITAIATITAIKPGIDPLNLFLLIFINSTSDVQDHESPTTVPRKTKNGIYKSFGGSVVCINSVHGVGKTELAIEFAQRYSQRYKMVIWVGVQGQYLRQSILNLSLYLGLDVSADGEKERGRTRLWVISSLLSELTISPSTLFQAINEILIDETSSHCDEPFWENNHFLLKVLIYCIKILDETKNHLALRMLLVGVWCLVYSQP
ncbi:AAA+ ATPase domain-containing protein [Tanacetum coccineum]